MIERYQIFLVLGVMFYLLVLVFLIVRRKINVRYSILWLSAAGIMLILAVFPYIVTVLAGFMGITVPVNLVFVLQGLFVLLIAIYLTSIVSWLTNRIHKLVQMQGLLEKRVRDLEEVQLNDKQGKDNDKWSIIT